MILHEDIRRAAAQWNLEDHIIEKDYVLGWLLWGIARHPVLAQSWALKGGLALKKCYVDTHRHSQDIDVTVLPGGPWKPADLSPILHQVCEEVGSVSGLAFGCKEPRFDIRPHGGSCEVRLYYVGPRGNPSPTAAKLDVSHAEDLISPPVLRPIFHPYPDSFPTDARIYCYSFEELFAEKIRALGERSRPGDLYDIVYLFRRSDLNAEPELIFEVLEHKCEFKGISVPCLSDFSDPHRRQEMVTRWESMLGRAVGHLPVLDDFWGELPVFFAWLTGEPCEVDLIPINREGAWKAPQLQWQLGQQELLEPIRYAAVNRLLLNLGYNGQFRAVEPYSLRLTRDGNVLFYAMKAQTRQIRSYRLDRIQSVEVLHQPFKPVYAVEFTAEGRIPAPGVKRRQWFISSRSRHRYVVECSMCGKRFYRKKYSTRLNPHKHKDSGARCSGRYGYLV